MSGSLEDGRASTGLGEGEGGGERGIEEGDGDGGASETRVFTDREEIRIVQGDVIERLRTLPDSSVHAVVCSPPYYGMRDYSVNGQIGLEENLGDYIETMVAVGREIGRVLRDDGSWWLNLGDSYNGNSIVRSGGIDSHVDADDEGYERQLAPNRDESGVSRRSASQMGMKRRCKMLIPHRVAIALIDDGWIVRNDAIWRKEYSLPESVKNRLSTTFEYFFHLVLDERYWYDLDAIREEYSDSTLDRVAQNRGNPVWKGESDRDHPDGDRAHTLDPDDFTHENGKNPGDIFEFPPAQFDGAHFAVMPVDLASVPVEVSCPPHVCSSCGTPHIAAESGVSDDTDSDAAGPDTDGPDGWRPGCECDAGDTDPGIVLDPFCGTGTTGVAARHHDRRFIGIELNDHYVALARSRLGIDLDEPGHLRDSGQTGFDSFAENGGGRGTET